MTSISTKTMTFTIIELGTGMVGEGYTPEHCINDARERLDSPLNFIQFKGRLIPASKAKHGDLILTADRAWIRAHG